MAIQGRQQAVAVEDKFERVLQILSQIKNPNDAQFLRYFIVDIYKKYIDIITTTINSENITLSELQYIQQIINDLQA